MMLTLLLEKVSFRISIYVYIYIYLVTFKVLHVHVLIVLTSSFFIMKYLVGCGCR